MSLNGLTVAVTGSRRASELAKIIASMGGIPYVAPTVGIGAKTTSEAHIETLVKSVKETDYVVFMTGPGVFTLMEMTDRLGLKDDLIHALKSVTIVARSPKPKDALQRFGLRTDIIPSSTHDNTAEGIAKEMLKHDLKGKKVAVLWHGIQESILKERLEKAGAKVSDFQVYDYSTKLTESGAKVLGSMGFQFIEPDEEKVIGLIKDAVAGKIDVITFTSPPSARNLFVIAAKHDLSKALKNAMNKVIVAAVGMPTRMAIEENDAKVDVMPEIYKMGPMMKTLAEYIKEHPNIKASK